MPAPIPSHWGGFSPSALFAHGEQGVWYDPTDLSSMFQDSAGTTAVTAVEQPVGKILDKSGRGNHATQSTSASRPVLSARVNLLTKTEQFNDATWQKTAATVSADATTAPDGTTTADAAIPTTANTYHTLSVPNITVQNSTYTLSIRAKSNGYNYITVQLSNTNSFTKYYEGVFNLSNGTVESTSRSVTYTGSRSINSLGNGWYECIITVNSIDANSTTLVQLVPQSTNDPTLAYAGNGTSGVYVWGADLRPTNIGVNLPVYQRVNTSTDYDTAGFPLYLKFDGVDDSLVTSSVDLSSTSNLSLFNSLRKASDAVSVFAYEFSATSSTNNGAFGLWAPVTGYSYQVRTRGSSDNTAAYSGYTAPITNIISSSIKSTAADVTAAISTRINGSSVANTSINSTNTTGNFGNYPLYIGSRNNASAFFNGSFYGLIIRGASTSTPQITATENWLRLRGRVY